MSDLILFDIDKTLINTHRLVQEGFQLGLSEHLEIPHHQFSKESRAYWDTLEVSTDFNPEEYVLFLSEKYDADPAELLNIIFAPELFRQAVYPDVVPTLTTLAAIYSLGIFSQGNVVYQQQKLELSGLRQWFPEEQTFILHRKLESRAVAELPESTVVDDKMEVVQTLANYAQVLPIWLNRIDEKNLESIPTIHSLTEINDIF